MLTSLLPGRPLVSPSLRGQRWPGRIRHAPVTGSGSRSISKPGQTRHHQLAAVVAGRGEKELRLIGSRASLWKRSQSFLQGALRQAFASSYCETTEAGMRPRSLTWIP